MIRKFVFTSRLARWFLLFLEYISRVWFQDFYKHGRSHVMANALSKLSNQIEPVGIPNQTCDVHLFALQPKWL
jgi:Uri superfamily endonuclease